MFKKVLLGIACVCLPMISIASTHHHKHYKRHYKHHRKHHAVRVVRLPYNAASLAVANNQLSVGNQDIQHFESNYLNLMRRWRVPGSSVAVMKDGHLLYAQGFGYADVSTQQSVTPASLFRIASISKAITAIATLQLVEAHKVSLDDKLPEILNDMSPLGNTNLNPAMNNISLRHLLTMSAGMDRGVNSNSYDPMFGPWPSSVTARLGETPASCEQMVAMHLGMHLAFKPGTQYAYSNLTYCTLGLVIDKVTGNNYDPQNYYNYVYSHILTPLGISDMRLAHTALSAHYPNEVHYYPYFSQSSERLALAKLPYSNTNLLENNYADGGWLATATDLVKIGDAFASYKLVSKSAVDTMLSPPAYLQYSDRAGDKYFGMGWSVHWVRNTLSWEKTGSFTGTNGFLLHTTNGYTYAILFNTRPDMTKSLHQQVKQLLFKTQFEATV